MSLRIETQNEMKALLNPLKIFVVMLGIAVSLAIYSCKEDDAPNNGEPVIYYIRNPDPARSDSLYVGAPLGNLIAIVGDNLGGTTKIMFNDQEAEVNPNYVTDKSILVTVPPDAACANADLMASNSMGRSLPSAG